MKGGVLRKGGKAPPAALGAMAVKGDEGSGHPAENLLANRKLHGHGAAARQIHQVFELCDFPKSREAVAKTPPMANGVEDAAVRQGDREGEDERKNLILAQARVRLGAGVVAPWGQGGPKGCVVRKVGNKNIPNKDGKAGGVRGPSSGGGRSADYFGTLVGESKVKAELRNLVDNRDGGIGQYQTLEQLGAGASGVVHLVRRIKDDTVWVAKRIQLTSGGNNLKMGPSSDRAAHMRRVQRDAVLEEIKLMSRIHSPHVIRFEASYALDNEIVIIMELAQGGSIADLIKERKDLVSRFDEDDIWRGALHILRGLRAIHELNVIHRDIKPANILISGAGDFKIADLGIAIQTGHSVQGRVRTVKAGTLVCMAPEILEDKPYNERVDVWSLGCTLYEMCYLAPAFPANSGSRDTDFKAVKAAQEALSRRSLVLPSCFSMALQHVVNKCLTHSQADRPHAKDLLESPELVAACLRSQDVVTRDKEGGRGRGVEGGWGGMGRLATLPVN